MTRDWELANPNAHLQALGSSVSDHCPMVLSCNLFHRRYRGFRFEAWWLQQPGFRDIVDQSWSQPVWSQNKARVLHIKLSRLTKRLKQWHRQHILDIKQDAQEAQQTILRLDQAQEQWQLTDAEVHQRSTAKSRILGLATVWRIKIRQRSRLTWIHAGDDNTKLFHLRANGRRRKNYIPALTVRDRTYTSQADKAKALKEHYDAHLGQPPQGECTINWAEIPVTRFDLSALDEDLTEEEIKSVVMHSPTEKAPGPNGYISAFYRTCWDTIK
jgi:hypothetical protein